LYALQEAMQANTLQGSSELTGEPTGEPTGAFTGFLIGKGGRRLTEPYKANTRLKKKLL